MYWKFDRMKRIFTVYGKVVSCAKYFIRLIDSQVVDSRTFLIKATLESSVHCNDIIELSNVK